MPSERIIKVVKAALKYQGEFIKLLPKGKIEEVKGRTGMLLVDDFTGKETTALYFQVQNRRLILLDEKPDDIRNEVVFFGMPEYNYTGVDCFMRAFNKRGYAREAVSAGEIVITGELASYDSEEMLQTLEEWINTISSRMEAEDY